MQQSKFTISNKKTGEIKPFLQIYQAKIECDLLHNYQVQIYSNQKLKNQHIKQSLQYNQCVFTDNFTLSTDNLLLYEKVQQTTNFSAIYYKKYNKNLQEYLFQRKKKRLPQNQCIKIIQDILKGLYTILQTGYRPVSIRTDGIVRIYNKSHSDKQDIWKIKNIIYSSKIIKQINNFLVYQEMYSPPEIYSRKNVKSIQNIQTDQYKSSLLVWSLGIIIVKMLGIQSKLDSKKKLSQFMDRQFNINDILYIRNQYSQQFLQTISLMLHFDHKKRMKLKDLFNCQIFKQKQKIISQNSKVSKKSNKSQNNTAESSQQLQKQDTSTKIIIKNGQSCMHNLHCNLFQFQKVF